jgi:hypothetical protein
LGIAAAGNDAFGWSVIKADVGAAFFDRSLEAIAGIPPESSLGRLDGADQGSGEEEGHDSGFGHELVPIFAEIESFRFASL